MLKFILEISTEYVEVHIHVHVHAVQYTTFLCFLLACSPFALLVN